MTNKKVLAAASMSFLLGLSIIPSTKTTQAVEASTSPRIQLRHNAYVYSAKGKRKSKFSLKRGTYFQTLGQKSIRGKKYYKIGKGKYIKFNNAVIPPDETKDKGPVLFSVYLKPGITLYSEPNGESSRETLIGKQKVYEIYKDANGQEWYRLPYKNWAKATDTQRSKPKEDEDISTSDNWDNPNDNTSIEEVKDELSSIPTGTAFDRSTIVETAKCFEKLVNDWRASQGVDTKMSYTDKHFDYDVSRSIHDAQHFDAYHDSDRHQGSSNFYGELEALVKEGTPQQMAQEAFNNFVFYDGSANFAHRDHLKRRSCTSFGLGLASTHKNGFYVNGVSFVVVTNN
ncbi:SLAP domain-containing protein [Lactobacillus apis]|uniref:S-layer protein C-terminal domain-containing protein n=1 Tax=Lactobacillus apis TaxID=303541 RepID=A0A0F4LPZ1_9LACO|nr:SLAP domain-containing protein [Lactobacillus apis]KJY59626.1 hypothetical protein JF72_14570 [Lactobacillus apis]